MDFILTERTTTSSLGVFDTVKGITNLYMGIGKGIVDIITALILLLIIFPPLLLGLNILILFLNITFKKELALLKETKITTEEEYDSLKELYKKLLQSSDKETDISDLPPFIQFFFKPYITHKSLVKALRKELAEKLYLLPKGLTEEQIAEAAKLNKGLEDFFSDDDDEYDYAKALALGEIKFIER